VSAYNVSIGHSISRGSRIQGRGREPPMAPMGTDHTDEGKEREKTTKESGKKKSECRLRISLVFLSHFLIDSFALLPPHRYHRSSSV
jgi:hypothetical protein